MVRRREVLSAVSSELHLLGSARSAKPLVERLARQAMLRGHLSWLYDELAKAFPFVQYVLAAAETIYG
jgi:hypothetical protein